ncbi:MAG: LptF/LptG family permease [Aquificota bacterium]|nr:LptF/LptG family permease [Aquificota bacterium]
MLRSLIFWKITKITYLTALVLATVLLLVQIYRLSFILFGLPLSDSVPFFISWFAYYSFFFIPDGIALATALTLYDLKERKLLQVMQSFHLSPLRILSLFLLPVGVFSALGLVFSFLLFEEQVSFARKELFIKYKDKALGNMPERTFLEIGDLVVYIRERGEGTLKGVFLKYRDLIVVAERATYESGGRFFFRKGYLVTKDQDKYFLISFETYRLDTEERFSAEIRKKRVSKERVMNLANMASIPFLFGISFMGSLMVCRTHIQVYYFIALCVILHQIALFTLKITL